ncbi:MAG: hypothetical protein AB9Q19_04345 [Candidatus Reddybacter sp.]
MTLSPTVVMSQGCRRTTDNGIGIAGVGWDSAIGSLKVCFEYFIDLYPPLDIWTIVGICPVSSSAAAITFAADQAYHVINMSYASDEVDENGDPLGLGGLSETEEAAVNYAGDRRCADSCRCRQQQ